MAVKTYSVSKLGRNYLVSPHFKLAEFQCRDKSDKVLIDTKLIEMLEKLREYLGGDGYCTIGINSGYRTPAYNVSVGGASKSKHTEGYAADIVVKQHGKRVSGKQICCLCQTLGFNGIAYIAGTGYAVHVDTRTSGQYRGDERYGYGNNVGNDFYSYFNIKKSTIDALKVAPKKEEQVIEAPEIKQEEEEMTQEQFNKMMDNYLAARAKEAPADWSKEARQWAEKTVDGQAIINGTGVGMEYESWVTREQMVTLLHRFADRIDPVK